MLLKMAVEKVVKELNLNVTHIHHCSIAEGKSAYKKFDIIFCPKNFLNMFKDAEKEGKIVIGLRNVMSAAEIKQNIIELGLDQKYKKP